MSVTDCYANIIGLSRTPCPCTEEGMPADADVSASGYYLDEAPHLNLRSVKDAAHGCPELWDMMDRARSNAVRDLKADLSTCVRSNAKEVRKPSTSIVGEWNEATKLLNPDTVYNGILLKTADVVGGLMTLRRIGIKLDTSGPIDVSVYDREDNTPLATYTVTAVAGSLAWYTLPTPLELPMTTGTSLNPKYYILWEPAGEKPYNTRVHCNCPGKFLPRYDDYHPHFESRVNRSGFGWADWTMATGVKGNDLSQREDWKKTNEILHGLVVEVSFLCDFQTTLCQGIPDYTDPLMQQQALAVMDRAVFYLFSFIKSSGNPSFYTLLEGESLSDHANRANEGYKARNEKLCELFTDPDNINRFSDCMMCEDKWGYKVSTIRP